LLAVSVSAILQVPLYTRGGTQGCRLEELMPVVTVVEDYIFAALRLAVRHDLEDGTVAGTIPQFPGLIAYGADVHECSRELYRLLEETIRVWLTKGYTLPIIEDIDLNAAKTQVLKSYHLSPREDEEGGEFCEDEEALERAFAEG
jgi:predicted RNase H-like HicB family nuclease